MLNGTITVLHRDRGSGSILGEDGKTYSFRRSALRDGWFHDLSEGARVTFDPAKPSPHFEAADVRLVRQE